MRNLRFFRRSFLRSFFFSFFCNSFQLLSQHNFPLKLAKLIHNFLTHSMKHFYELWWERFFLLWWWFSLVVVTFLRCCREKLLLMTENLCFSLSPVKEINKNWTYWSFTLGTKNFSLNQHKTFKMYLNKLKLKLSRNL